RRSALDNLLAGINQACGLSGAGRNQVKVYDAEQVRALGTEITDIEDQPLTYFTLHIEAPLLYVRSHGVIRNTAQVGRSAGDIGQDHTRAFQTGIADTDAADEWGIAEDVLLHDPEEAGVVADPVSAAH